MPDFRIRIILEHENAREGARRVQRELQRTGTAAERAQRAVRRLDQTRMNRIEANINRITNEFTEFHTLAQTQSALLNKSLTRMNRLLAMVARNTRGVRNGFDGINGAGVDRAAASVDRLNGGLGLTRSVLERMRLVFARIFVGTFFYQAIRGAITAFAEFERRMIAVRKTTDITIMSMNQLGEEIRLLARDTPVAVSALQDITVTAGQLGIRGTENLLQFTETIGQLGVATDLYGENAATIFARILTITGTPTQEVDRLGSVIVELGNNFAATESEIAAVANRVAQATSAFDISAAEILGISAALRQLGVLSEVGGTVVGRAFNAINRALRSGGSELQALEEITQETGDALREDFFGGQQADVFLRFIQGLTRIREEGGNFNETLQRLGLNGVRIDAVLGALAKRSDVLRRSLGLANDEWERNTALQQEVGIFLTSLSAQLQLFRNLWNEIAILLGEHLAPAVRAATDNLREFLIEAEFTGELRFVFGGIAAAARLVGDNIEILARGAIALLLSRIGVLLIRYPLLLLMWSIEQVRAGRKAVRSLTGITTALRVQQAATLGLRRSYQGLLGVLAIFGGPVGIAAGIANIAITLGISYAVLSSAFDNNAEAAIRNHDELERLVEIQKELNGTSLTAEQRLRAERDQLLENARLRREEARERFLELQSQREISRVDPFGFQVGLDVPGILRTRGDLERAREALERASLHLERLETAGTNPEDNDFLSGIPGERDFRTGAPQAIQDPGNREAELRRTIQRLQDRAATGGLFGIERRVQDLVRRTQENIRRSLLSEDAERPLDDVERLSTLNDEQQRAIRLGVERSTVAEEQGRILDRLRGSEEGLRIIRRALIGLLATGRISWQEYNEELERAQEVQEQSRSSFAQTIEDLKEQIRLAGLSAGERRVETALTRIQNQFKRDEVALTDDQIAAFRRYLVQLGEVNEAQREQARTVQEVQNLLGTPVTEYEDFVRRLANAYAAGAVNAEMFFEATERANQQRREQAPTFGELTEEIRKEREQLGLSSFELEVQAEHQRLLNRLKEGGRDVSEAQRLALLAEARATVRARGEAERFRDAFESLRDPQDAFLEGSRAIEAVVARYPETTDRAARALDRLRQEYLATQDDLVSGIELGLRRVASQSEMTAEIVASALEGAFDDASRALADFIVTGEANLARFIQNLAREVLAAGIRGAIINPIAGALGSSLFGFQHGGQFVVGGATGLDRNIIGINGVPVARVGRGELVTVTPPGGRGGGGGSAPVTIYISTNVEAGSGEPSEVAREVVEQQMAQLHTSLNRLVDERIIENVRPNGLLNRG